MSLSSTGLVTTAHEKIQKELNSLMQVLEEVQAHIPEGAYLRGMNALVALYKQKHTAFESIRSGAMMSNWTTLDDILQEDIELYYEIADVADRIVAELCGRNASIYNDNFVRLGDEQYIFGRLADYKPEEGNAGYETSPMVLHHAIQVIMKRLFNDTYYELVDVRPVSCLCGWRGPHRNWERHIDNMRHQRWLNTENRNRQVAYSAYEANLDQSRQFVSQILSNARRENGMVYIKEIDILSLSPPQGETAFKVALEEAITEFRNLTGEHVVFVSDETGELSWFA